MGWVFWGLLILLINNGVTTYSAPLGVVLFVLGGYTPTVAAIAVQKNRDPKSILKFLFKGDSKGLPFFLLFCVILAVTFYFTSRQLSGDMALWFFPVYWIGQMFMGGFEEQGWRGVMQPALEKSLPFPVAVILTGITWGVWHLPLWFMAGSGQDEFPFYAFVVFCVVLSFGLAVIRKKTNSVIYCCVFHAFNNALLGYIVIGVNGVLAVGGGAIIIVALAIWYAEKHRGLAGVQARQVS